MSAKKWFLSVMPQTVIRSIRNTVTQQATDAKSGIKKLTSSYRLKEGTRPDGPKGAYDGTYLQDFEYVADLGDLDEFNGRTGITPEYPNGTYYYVITDSFPYMSRAFKGIPDKSFQKGGEGGGRGRPPGGQGTAERTTPAGQTFLISISCECHRHLWHFVFLFGDKFRSFVKVL